MVEIRITYETLFDLLRREKNREELQKLDDDFYDQVIAYLREKQETINKKDERLFLSADKEKLKIQFQNIRRIVKELYEKREKKVIHMAVVKARTGSDVIDTTALLPTEREFFEEQVIIITKYKESLLDCVLAVREIDIKTPYTAKKIAAQVKVTAASDAADAAYDNSAEGRAPPQTGNLTHQSSESEDESAVVDTGDDSHFAVQKDHDGMDENGMRKVKFKVSLPEFMGREGEVLGPFHEGEIAELDGTIADLLIRKGRAEAF